MARGFAYGKPACARFTGAYALPYAPEGAAADRLENAAAIL